MMPCETRYTQAVDEQLTDAKNCVAAFEALLDRICLG